MMLVPLKFISVFKRRLAEQTYGHADITTQPHVSLQVKESRPKRSQKLNNISTVAAKNV
jgi:hypothetical protein